MPRASLLITLSGFAIGVAVGCGSVVTVTTTTGSGTGGSDGAGNGGSGAGGGSADAGEEYIDPGCPDAGMKPTSFACDPFNQDDGDCPPGDGCYIYSTPPKTVCGQETYGSECAPEGTGMQGAACGDQNVGCAAGFTCVVSGAGNQCVLLCELQGGMECPNGLVCQPIDVMGFGGCL